MCIEHALRNPISEDGYRFSSMKNCGRSRNNNSGKNGAGTITPVITTGGLLLINVW